MVTAQPDDSIAFMQLFAKADQSVAENQFEISLLQAIGTPVGTKKDDGIANSSLNKVSETSIYFSRELPFQGSLTEDLKLVVL